MAFPFIDDRNDYTPINDVRAVTPSDAADLPGGTCRALFITAAGTLQITTARGNVVGLTFPATACGLVCYIRASRIWATGTTATALACY